MKILSTSLDRVFLIEPKVFIDERGSFIKTFHKTTFDDHGLDCDFKESFYSISNKDVVRGMHFQLPPHDHSKLIYVTKGKIIDVALDIRKGSPTYGQYVISELSEENRAMVHIGPGFAHGFLSLEDGTCVSYLHTSTHSPDHDNGIRFDSFDMQWNIDHPTVSDRDAGFPTLDDFVTPFTY